MGDEHTDLPERMRVAAAAWGSAEYQSVAEYRAGSQLAALARTASDRIEALEAEVAAFGAKLIRERNALNAQGMMR